MIKEKDTSMEQLILETAEKLFLEKGFAMTSTTEIAKQIGCNQALVHYYFRTKAKLFEAIFEKKVKMFVGPFLQTNAESIPFEAYLQQLIEAHFELIRANPKVPFLFFNEMLTNPARLELFKTKLAALPRSVIQKMDSTLKVEISKGTVRPINTIDLLISIFSLNVTLFLMGPILKNGLNISEAEMNVIIENRKRENVLIILRSIQP